MVIKGNKHNDLFNEELKVLETSLKYSENPQYCNNELLYQFNVLLSEYEKLLNLAIKFCKISDNQGRLLLEREAELKTILTDVTEQLETKEKIEYLSYHDYLTTLYNRAYIEKKISDILSSNNFPLSILYIDMNGLKLTNDVFGHETGDKLIISFAKILLLSCKKTELIARWGGDEFLIIIPNADEQTALRLKNKIKYSCKVMTGIPIKVSAAIGVATSNQPPTNISDLIKIAEKRMYKEKILEGPKIRQRMIEQIKRNFTSISVEHTNKIAQTIKMTVTFAKKLNFHPTSAEIKTLKKIITWHNLGKAEVPNHLLSNNKNNLFTHPNEIGYRIAQAIGEPLVAECIIAINEHWDGSGSPFGLKGEEIPYFSRITAIINAFCDFVYNNQNNVNSQQEAIAKITFRKGSYFDPSLVEVFLAHVDEITK